MSRVNVLTVEWRSTPRRAGQIAAELVVDGHPLLEYCERATGQSFGVVSPFGWTAPEHQVAVAERLLLRRPPLLPSGRREFLVCTECAGLDCGCISAVVTSEDDCYIWSEFGYGNDYDPDSLWLFSMGSFTIRKEEVARLIGGSASFQSKPAG